MFCTARMITIAAFTEKSSSCSDLYLSTPSYALLVNTDIKEGVKYTLSVYGCTSEASYYLLQRREGYMVELRKYSVFTLFYLKTILQR